jgi:hypothetical protein
MIPLYGFLEGDTIGLLILGHQDDTVAALADKLKSAARVRVAPFTDARVLAHGRELDPKQTLATTGLTALDRFDVRRSARSSREPADGPKGTRE